MADSVVVHAESPVTSHQSCSFDASPLHQHSTSNTSRRHSPLEARVSPLSTSPSSSGTPVNSSPTTRETTPTLSASASAGQHYCQSQLVNQVVITPTTSTTVSPHFKPFQQHQAALVSSMLQTSNPNTSNGGNPTQHDLLLNYPLPQHHPQGPETKLSLANPVATSGVTGYQSEQSNARHHHSTSSSLMANNSNGTANNEVRNVMLYGIPIVSLVMDGQERLCLAQISNTLLKNFSYNEIHNRRVALGITCVQCTPVQLELLRRAGAMPVSSRRCGMITKREAERLCKSFLAETAPPKLPDTFSFDVYHSCAWGCRGSFTPSRYNSSRAKCIKCIYCGLFFSPNKFIFHSHRLPTSKYVQPDAANFNSWRRHIKLVGNPEPSEQEVYAWEDVKAMFNGGSRKRAMSSTMNSFTKNQENRANSSRVEANSIKYKYTDDNSGMEDSDEYLSQDGSKTRTEHPTNNQSPESDQDTNNVYNFQSQVNTKSLFESHFQKAFEVGSLVNSNNSHPKSSQFGPNNTPRKEPNSMSSPSLSSTSMSSAPSPPSSKPAGINSNETIKTEGVAGSFSGADYFSPKSKPVNGVTQPELPFSSAHSAESLAHNYGLFRGANFVLNRHQVTPSTVANSPHPAILNTLLTTAPDGASNIASHLRPALLTPGYAPLSSVAVTSSTEMSPTSLINTHSTGSTLSSISTPSIAPSSADFRNNLAEFMWSMASKASPQILPYNLLWPNSNSGQLMNAPTSFQPVNNSTNSSPTTPNLSPTTDASIDGQEELRRALLLHHHQQQQRNVNLSSFSPLSQLNASHTLPFLPNLIGHNFRLMPNIHSTTVPLSANNLQQSYLMSKENVDSVELNSQRQNKTPDGNNPMALTSPIFPLRPTPSFATSSNSHISSMDRFSSEMIAARNQLIFDAYTNATNIDPSSHAQSIFAQRQPLFPPNIFLDPNSSSKPFLSDHQRQLDNNENHETKSVDVIGGSGEEGQVPLSLKTIYPLTYSVGVPLAKTQVLFKGNNSATIKTKKGSKRSGDGEGRDMSKAKKINNLKKNSNAKIQGKKANNSHASHDKEPNVKISANEFAGETCDVEINVADDNEHPTNRTQVNENEHLNADSDSNSETSKQIESNSIYENKASPLNIQYNSTTRKGFGDYSGISSQVEFNAALRLGDSGKMFTLMNENSQNNQNKLATSSV